MHRAALPRLPCPWLESLQQDSQLVVSEECCCALAPREQGEPGERAIAGVLLDAPALPQPACADFLRDCAASGGDWATLALSAARDVALQRPPDRGPMLALILDAAACEDAPLRRAHADPRLGKTAILHAR